jgi:NADPH:quinone reductase-like Zn-dependent oxidoreductase
MKAIVYHRYGSPDVLRCKDVDKPVPGDDEVLIKVRAASINPADWHLMRGKPYLFRLMIGLRKPKITRLGADVAGVVEAVGRNVTQFKPGDEVFGVCRGALAGCVCTSESKLAMKPDTVTFEQAASVPLAALTALQGLRDKGHIQQGQKVLINGAAGGVGTFAVQLAKCFGADVTAVCSSRNVEMVRSIGADRVIDYTRQDFTKSEQRYDLIFDFAAGRSLLACRRVLNPKGTYIAAGVAPGASMIGFVVRLITAATVLSRLASWNFTMFVTKWNKADLTTMQELMKAGKVTPVIDRCYSLNEAAEAIQYLEEGHARGKVVIVLEQN